LPAMNKPIIAGLAAGVLLAGLMLAAPFSGNFGLDPATAQSTGKIKKVTLIGDEAEVQVAPDNDLHPGGIMYTAMVFNGTIPGPVIAADQGDTIEMNLINQGETIHSIDFHAAIGPTKVNSGNVEPGQNKTWTFDVPNAGFFMYHCAADGLNGVWEHIANGMYGGLVVHPVNEKPAKEFYLSFGEIYNSADQGLFVGANGTGSFDIAKFATEQPDLIMTNGMAHKYVPSVGEKVKIELNPDGELFQVKPGELTRWYVLAPGPNEGVSFHFISGQIDVRDGSIMNRLGTQLRNDETWWVPPGSGSVIESTFPEEGVYVGVDHNMAHVVKGGAIAVLATANATDTDHPVGTWVPPRGSELVSGPSMMNETGGANATGTAANATGNITAAGAAGNTTITGNATNATGTGNMTAAGAGNATTTTGNMTGGNMTSNATTGAMPGNTTTSTGPTTPAPTTPAPTSATGGGGGNSVEVSIPQGSSTLSDGAYDPNPVQVSAGGTVTWTNDDAQPHTATSGENAAPDGIFDSSILAAGKSFSHTFAEAGEYPYYCMLHPNMVGTVSVS
jgi:nitrite reductase (NO-forming)